MNDQKEQKKCNHCDQGCSYCGCLVPISRCGHCQAYCRPSVPTLVGSEEWWTNSLENLCSDLKMDIPKMKDIFQRDLELFIAQLLAAQAKQIRMEEREEHKKAFEHGYERGKQEVGPHPFTTMGQEIKVIADLLLKCAINEETCQVAQYANDKTQLLKEDFVITSLKRENEKLHRYIDDLEDQLQEAQSKIFNQLKK